MTHEAACAARDLSVLLHKLGCIRMDVGLGLVDALTVRHLEWYRSRINTDLI
jgi:hypothetical protein